CDGAAEAAPSTILLRTAPYRAMSSRSFPALAQRVQTADGARFVFAGREQVHLVHARSRTRSPWAWSLRVVSIVEGRASARPSQRSTSWPDSLRSALRRRRRSGALHNPASHHAVPRDVLSIISRSRAARAVLGG